MYECKLNTSVMNNLFSGRFLGDQRASYNHKLSFYLRIGELGPQATTEDIILDGAGLSISAPIFAQGNSLPSTQVSCSMHSLFDTVHRQGMALLVLHNANNG